MNNPKQETEYLFLKQRGLINLFFFLKLKGQIYNLLRKTK